MTPNQPGRKQWYDRLADAILGDEDPAPASPSSRYALICEKCFTHNGLVKESAWEDARELFLLLFRSLFDFAIGDRISLPEMWPLQPVCKVKETTFGFFAVSGHETPGSCEPGASDNGNVLATTNAFRVGSSDCRQRRVDVYGR